MIEDPSLNPEEGTSLTEEGHGHGEESEGTGLAQFSPLSPRSSYSALSYLPMTF